MPLFALAFVERPQDHPEVGEVFKEPWRQRLRSDVEVALRQQRPGPVLYDLMKPWPEEKRWQARQP